MINWEYLALFVAGFGAGITWYYGMYLYYTRRKDDGKEGDIK